MAAADGASGSGWLARLRAGLAKSSAKLGGGLAGLFGGGKLDEEMLDDLETLLIGADLGVETAGRLTRALSEARLGKTVSVEDVQSILADRITEILEPVATPLTFDEEGLCVVMVVGVNGSGKTTTVGKLAARLAGEGKKVVVAAADTFRAAAVEQLQVWGERAGVPVITGAREADPASVAHSAVEKALAENADILIVDTAGRLHNKSDLMAELSKIRRVISRQIDDQPKHCLLVLDATVGQNAHQQVDTFRELTNVTGLVLTKLDGSARGGVLVALAERFGLPVHAIGVGEGVEDLRPFDPRAFAKGLLGLPD